MQGPGMDRHFPVSIATMVCLETLTSFARSSCPEPTHCAENLDFILHLLPIPHISWHSTAGTPRRERSRERAVQVKGTRLILAMGCPRRYQSLLRDEGVLIRGEPWNSKQGSHSPDCKNGEQYPENLECPQSCFLGYFRASLVFNKIGHLFPGKINDDDPDDKCSFSKIMY